MPTSPPPSPKRATTIPEGQSSYYSYYAGYTTAFAKAMIERLQPDRSALVLDPWNGAGTTTAACAELSRPAVGNDLNPVMAVIAKGRLLSARTSASVLPLTKKIVSNLCRSEIARTDPLCDWLTSSAATSMRCLERSVYSHLVEKNQQSLACWSDLACFFYIGLFNVMRQLLQPLRSSNPTWLKKPKEESQKIDATVLDIVECFSNQMESLAASLERSAISHQNDSTTKILLGSSTRLDLEDSSVGTVLTSPPYCTRIDYAVATAGELAVLGSALETDFNALRRSLMGTATVERQAEESLLWGYTCLSFLEQMQSHASKASSTYYYKNHCKYFDSLYASISEIGRVLRSNGSCVIVVQNSYYKEILNDLPQICIEMGEANGLRFDEGHSYEVLASMARQNPRAMKYSAQRHECEEVLIFKKVG